jgi:serine/threonine protein kinase
VLTALLGEGAFGRVFAAEHVETKQQLALKIVGLSRYPREYAEHELSALAAIMHPNVVQLNEYGVEIGAPEPFLWYTMPLYRGEDLASLIETRGPLPLRAAHGIFARIAGGVCEMHDSGLRHQDIKPENIYLARMTGVDDHHPVLLDLGGAAREGSTSPLIATLGFAAPEQSDALLGMQLGERRRVELSGKIDVYALAATLLYALLGKCEFRGYDIGQREGDDIESSDGLEKLRQELWAVQEAREARPLPDGSFPEMSRAERQRLNAAFRGWLTRDPEARPDARTLLRELSVLLEWDNALARAAERSRRRRAVLVVTAGSAVAAGAGGLAGYQYHRYAMSRAEEVAQAALRGRDAAASALRRADDVLDGIVADATLGPAEKARKIGVVIESLRAQASQLVDSNHELKAKLEELERARQSLEQSRDRALRERKSAIDARVEALAAARAAEEAKARADAERERALVEKLLSESAKARADTEREQAVRERRAAERNRADAEAERDRAVRERRSLEEAKARVEDERDAARAEQKAAEEAGFARGLAAGAQPKVPDPPPGS